MTATITTSTSTVTTLTRTSVTSTATSTTTTTTCRGEAALGASTGTCLPYVSSIAAPNLTVTSDAFGVVLLTLAVHSGLVINSGTLLEFSTVYLVDIAPEATNLTLESSCRSEWTVSGQEAQARLTYPELSGPCSLSAVSSEGRVDRDGFLGIHLVATNVWGSETLHRRWITPLNLTFDFEAIHFDDRSFYVGEFQATLAIFESTAFERPSEALSLPYGSDVPVQHGLESSYAGASLELAAVWLSSSPDAGNLSAVLSDLTGVVERHNSSAGGRQVRFRFGATWCRSCFLHCVSLVTRPGVAQPAGAELHSLQTLRLEIEAEREVASNAVRGAGAAAAMVFAVAQAVVFVALPL